VRIAPDDNTKYVYAAEERLIAAEDALRSALEAVSHAGGPFCNCIYRELERSIECVIGTRSRLPRLEWGVAAEVTK
jgi:hypothetical protein